MPSSTLREQPTDRQGTKPHAFPAGGRIRLARNAGFWAIGASLAVLTAFSTAPSPLYGLYQQPRRLVIDHHHGRLCGVRRWACDESALGRPRLGLVRPPTSAHSGPDDRVGCRTHLLLFHFPAGAVRGSRADGFGPGRRRCYGDCVFDVTWISTRRGLRPGDHRSSPRLPTSAGLAVGPLVAGLLARIRRHCSPASLFYLRSAAWSCRVGDGTGT